MNEYHTYTIKVVTEDEDIVFKTRAEHLSIGVLSAFKKARDGDLIRIYDSVKTADGQWYHELADEFLYPVDVH